MIEKRILEQLEACRPGRAEDLAQPEIAEAAQQLPQDEHLAARFARQQQRDARIARAIGDVPVPAGLAERLADSLNAESARPQPVSPARRLARLAAVGLAGIAAAVLLALSLSFWKPAIDVTLANWPELAEGWYRQAVENGSWHAPAGAPRDYFVSGRVLAPARAWTALETATGRRAVAYDLTAGEDRERVILLVLQAQLPGLPSTPPPEPQRFTQGRSLAAWQSGELLYVLVVEGNNPGRYRALVDSSIGPLALHLPALPRPHNRHTHPKITPALHRPPRIPQFA